METPDFEEMNYFERFAAIEEQTAVEANDLFGKCEGSGSESCACRTCTGEDLSDEEFNIIFSDLSHAEKLAALKPLRAAKAVKPTSFRKHITPADRIHARGMGIKLD